MSARVEELVARLTLEEKLAQLVGLWAGVAPDGFAVAPMQDQIADEVLDFETYAKNGLGQLTRVLGSRPLQPAEGARALAGLRPLALGRDSPCNRLTPGTGTRWPPS